jgi:hypothetical protein
VKERGVFKERGSKFPIAVRSKETPDGLLYPQPERNPIRENIFCSRRGTKGHAEKIPQASEPTKRFLDRRFPCEVDCPFRPREEPWPLHESQKLPPHQKKGLRMPSTQDYRGPLELSVELQDWK